MTITAFIDLINYFMTLASFTDIFPYIDIFEKQCDLLDSGESEQHISTSVINNTACIYRAAFCGDEFNTSAFYGGSFNTAVQGISSLYGGIFYHSAALTEERQAYSCACSRLMDINRQDAANFMQNYAENISAATNCADLYGSESTLLLLSNAELYDTALNKQATFLSIGKAAADISDNFVGANDKAVFGEYFAFAPCEVNSVLKANSLLSFTDLERGFNEVHTLYNNWDSLYQSLASTTRTRLSNTALLSTSLYNRAENDLQDSITEGNKTDFNISAYKSEMLLSDNDVKNIDNSRCFNINVNFSAYGEMNSEKNVRRLADVFVDRLRQELACCGEGVHY